MVKTAVIDDDTHKYLKDVQRMLKEKYHVRMSIQDIIGYMVPKPDREEGVQKIIDAIKT